MHLLMALLLCTQDPAQAQAAPAQTAEPPPPVSLERIRRGLESPPTTVTVRLSDPNLPPIFRLEVRERPLPYEHLWQGDWVSAHVRPFRGLTHHEFVEQVTPEIFRGTVMYPCCPVLPAVNFLLNKLKNDDGRAKARLEVMKALKDFREQQQKDNAAQRLPDAK
jgi:hypothetical protein